MQYNRLGDSGLVVSKLTFGAGSLGVGQTLPGLNKHVDQKSSVEMVARAIDAGITCFDNADGYVEGQSEIMLGKALGARRKDVIVATKGGLTTGKRDWNQGGTSAKHMIQACEDSLRRMNTDWIDIYYTHAPDKNTPIEETTRAFELLIRSGKVRYAGVCNYPAWMASNVQTFQALNRYSPLICNQVYYSMLGRLPERELVPLSKATGLGIIGYQALAGGFLTGKYTRENPAPEGTRRATFALAPKINLDKGYEVVTYLTQMAKEHNTTPAQIAIAYAMNKPWMNSTIFGVSSMAQLNENLGAVDLKLSAEEWAKLDTLSPPSQGFRV